MPRHATNHTQEEQLERIKMPGNALDLLVTAFGVNGIAEMTGRKHRIVPVAGGGFERKARAREGEAHDQVRALLCFAPSPPTP